MTNIELIYQANSADIEALEEVALEIDKLKAFGDTASSFANFVRSFKR